MIWEYSPEFHRELFPNILRIYHGNVPQILHEQYSRNVIWEYSPEFHCKLFPNILGIYHGNVPRIFHEHILGRWALIWGSISKTANIFWNILGSTYWLQSIWKNDTSNFCLLFISRVKMTKVNFHFYKQCNQGAARLICKRAI